ncbi:hypothetical protein AM493_08195 [Flavobacterium akiainvivens]|uniref:Uncharacterized protein n=1 Tax=Flavobacterium akiainvivens TaxID=1202724 RepID=A0A0M9VHX7_9FLAO|nr:heme exporter protein CcmD [Flavobacterium akiainvivens]KOS06019.1 hypothetical protein AM493_08195 [Flavobacterium akiainvivens]SFQ54279.1 hypothetical protein SAMN05444144_107121 [Flavobacterium akiainvivens]
MGKYGGYIVLVFLIGVVLFATLRKDTYRKEIAEHKGTTICKFTYCYHANKSSQARVRYYIDGVKFKNGYDDCPDNYRDKLKHFYVMYYSTLDPNKITVDFTKEITDTTAILNAGFSVEELGSDAIEKGEE